MTKPYAERVAAQVFKDNMEMARHCDRTNLKSVSDACAWLETQAAAHSEAGILLDELRPIRDNLMTSQYVERSIESKTLTRNEWELLDQQLKDAIEGRHKAEAELLKLETGLLRKDMIREIKHQNRVELELIRAAVGVFTADVGTRQELSELGKATSSAAMRFLIARWKEHELLPARQLTGAEMAEREKEEGK
jgi:hypothetical protein